MLKTTNNERIYHDHYNNLAYANKNGVISGCEVTAASPSALSVNIALGEVFFGTTSVDIGAQILAGFVIPDGINKRMDLVAIDSSHNIVILSGDAYKHPTDPRPPAYDPDDYIILARIEFDATDSVIETSNIKDMRVLNEGGSGTGGGGLSKKITSFSGVTTVTVNHELSDSAPLVQVYDENSEQITPDTIDIIDADNVRVDFLTLSTGSVTVQGGTGVDIGTTAQYVLNFVNQTSVNLTHGLDQKYVNVEAYNEADELMSISNITLLGSNSLTVDFSSMTSGTITVVGGASETSIPTGQMDYVAFDVDTVESGDSGDTTAHTYSLSTAQTNYDHLVVLVQGQSAASGSNGGVVVTPPDTSDIKVLWNQSDVSGHQGRCGGFCILTAGTDYTKGAAETITIYVQGGGGAQYHSTYFGSIIMGFDD